MKRLLAFIVQTFTPEFYGEIRVRAKAGEIVKVVVERDYLEDTLPVPPTAGKERPTANA